VQRGAGRAALSGEQGVDDKGVDDRPAGDHGPQRADQFIPVADPLLEQVGEPRGALPEEGPCVRGVRVLRQHDDPRWWAAPS